MICNIKKNDYKLILIISLIFINLILIPIPALSNSINKFIKINSNYQFFDIKHNKIIFTDNVILFYKNIKIYSEKIVINNFNKKNYKKIIIYAYGNPVTFYRKYNGFCTKGHANKIEFQPSNYFLKLLGNAYIQELNNSISSHKIIFLLKEKK